MDSVTVNGSIIGEGTYTGGIIGYFYDDNIFLTNNTVAVSISGIDYVGGIAGGMDGQGNCGKCVFQGNTGSGTVTGAGDCVGGLVGCSFQLNINECSFVGNVSGAGWGTGGILGADYGGSGSIRSSSFQGNIVGGTSSIGGIAGNTEGSISTVYSKGTVSAPTTADKTGGLIGYTDDFVTKSYALTTVTGAVSPGGLVGDHYSATPTYSYWDPTTSGQNRGIGTNATQEVVNQYEKLTAIQMESPANFPTWDFVYDWDFPAGGGTPILRAPSTCTTTPSVVINDSSTRYGATTS